MKFENLTSEILTEAIDIYLLSAYDKDELRKEHAVEFKAGLNFNALLAELEEETDKNNPQANKSYILRLGSEDYPHMKLSIHEAYYQGEFIFTVDCHDNFRFDYSAPDYSEWQKLKNHNRQRKLKIEKEWYDAGLPTLRSLKETVLSRTDCIRDFGGHELLIVEDDPDAAAIVSLILSSAGYLCHHERTVAGVAEYIANSDCKCGMAIVDVVLCDGNGVDVIKAIRAEPIVQDIPIIVTSAMSELHVKYDGFEAENYLRKPFNAKVLIDKVEKILRVEYDGHKVFLTDRT